MRQSFVEQRALVSISIYLDRFFSNQQISCPTIRLFKVRQGDAPFFDYEAKRNDGI